MKTYRIFTFSLVSVLSVALLVNTASANNGTCDVFYKTALFDEIRGTNTHKSNEVIKHELCYAYNRLKSDKQKGQVSGNYKLIGGSVQYGAEQLESIGTEMCEKNFSSTMTDSNRTNYSKVVSGEGRKIIEACLNADTKGLRISGLDMGTEGTGPLTVALVWSPSGVNSALTINEITWMPKTAQLFCSGSLWNHKNGGKLKLNKNETLNCTNDSDDFVRVVIDTAAEALTFNLPPKAKTISNAHKRILDFIYDTPYRYDSVQLAKHTHAEFKSDLIKLTDLFNNFVDDITTNNPDNQHFKFYKETYSDLDRAIELAKNRADPINGGLPVNDKYIDWHLSFFSDFKKILSNLSSLHHQNNSMNKADAGKFKDEVESARLGGVK